jgi:hypothetical protein
VAPCSGHRTVSTAYQCTRPRRPADGTDSRLRFPSGPPLRRQSLVPGAPAGDVKAEGVGFEPTRSLHPWLFSRQLQSTALPSLQGGSTASVMTPKTFVLGFYGPAPMHAHPRAIYTRSTVAVPSWSVLPVAPPPAHASERRAPSRVGHGSFSAPRNGLAAPSIAQSGLKPLKRVKPSYSRATAPGLYGLVS